MSKNLPQRERAARQSRSNYSNPQREGGPKSSFLYSPWVKNKGLPPENIRLELQALGGWNFKGLKIEGIG